MNLLSNHITMLPSVQDQSREVRLFTEKTVTTIKIVDTNQRPRIRSPLWVLRGINGASHIMSLSRKGSTSDNTNLLYSSLSQVAKAILELIIINNDFKCWRCEYGNNVVWGKYP